MYFHAPRLRNYRLRGNAQALASLIRASYTFCMHALYIDEPLAARLGEVSEPKMGNGDVLLKIRVIGFCGTDLSTFRGKNPVVSYPRIPGHEIAATILEAGRDVPAEFSIGRNVAVLPY